MLTSASRTHLTIAHTQCNVFQGAHHTVCTLNVSKAAVTKITTLQLATGYVLQLASVKIQTSFTGLFPATSAPLVDQYLAANGIILGKANLGELQSGGATNPTVSGTNREGFVYNITTALNPYDPTRTPQGAFSRKPLNSMVSSYLHILVYCARTQAV